MEEQNQPEASESRLALEQLIRRVLIGGWVCLMLSTLMLAISIFTASAEHGSEVTQVVWLTLARTVGIASFCIGLIGIFNRHWCQGTFLIAGSIFLPGISLLYHGSF